MRTLAITILLLFTAMLFACSGYFSASNNTNSNQANSETNPAPAENADIDANADMDANANANLINNAPVKRAPAPPKNDLLTRDAPDDSVITAENDPDGDLVETRIFKNHDMVAKVERILPSSRREGSVRVFLKNGKVYEFPVSRLKNALKDSPDEIVKTVGETVVATGTGPAAANRAATDGKGNPATSANTAATPRKQ
jgi:hypothetical protein